ncbi:MAG: peptide ABC transporter substrate-binding protein [Verrucomicrobiota bacterium]
MAFSLLILLTGCSDKMTNVERGNRDKEFYIGLGTEPATLDPHLLTGLTELYVLIAFIEGLTTYNAEDMSILPGVAQSWDISEDGLIYTFHFDPEARWSNGDRVTPQDFLFSFERILTPALGAPYASMLYPMKGAEAFNTGQTSDFSTVGVSAPDVGTLIIELESQTPYFLSILTHNAWWPVHPPTILKHGKMTDRLSKWTRPENFVGNGPFAIDSWRLNSALSGKRNPYYRAPENVGLNGIHFLPIETNAEERAFRAGQLHVTENIPIHRLDWYRENKPENMRIETTLGVYYYLVNVETEALSDKRIRQALAYTINREEIADYVLKAGQQPAYHFTPPNAGGYNARARLPYDPELARKLIAEAGYPGGEGFPKIELLYNTSEAHRAIAVAIQQMWKEELGIEIELYNQEWKAYLATRQEGSFQMCRAAWFGDYDDPNTFLSLAKTGDGNNHSNWSHPEFDRLLDEAARTADSEARKEVFQQAEEILIEEMPFIPIYFYVTTKLVHESVRGWYPSILDYHPYQAITLETN